MTNKDTTECYEIIVDCWENQRYKPLQGGWQSPFKTGMPSYSDIGGEIEIQYDNNKKEIISYLPQGWKWSTKWMLDQSSSFGTVDMNFWGYASSFEVLVDNCMNRCLNGELNISSYTRRRRWVRIMSCVTEDSIKFYNDRKFWIDSICDKKLQIICEKEEEYIQLIKYEQLRQEYYETLLMHVDDTLSQTVELIDGVEEKLNSMKSFLIERGKIEREYANNLESLSNKWINAGTTPPGKKINKNSKNIPVEKSGFFYVICTTFSSISTRFLDFSRLITDSLPLDVEEVKNEVIEVRSRSVVKEGPKMRLLVQYRNENITFFHKKYINNHKSYIVNSQIEITKLRESINLISAGDKDLNVARVTKWSNKSNINSNIDNIQDNTEISDGWYLCQLYFKAIQETNSALISYKEFAIKQFIESRNTSSKVSSLLQSTVKILVHEQSRVWEESSILLQDMIQKQNNSEEGEKWEDEVIDDENDEYYEDNGLNSLNIELPILNLNSSICHKGILSLQINNIWNNVMCLITYDLNLFIFPIDSDFEDEDKWINDKPPIHSINLKLMDVAPVLIPSTPDNNEYFDTYLIKNAFEIKLKDSNIPATITRRDSIGRELANTKKIKNISYVLSAKEATTALHWMKIISLPYSDPNLEIPEFNDSTEISSIPIIKKTSLLDKDLE